ncbi:FAD-dependent oxidoreductase [Flindersiella endophytica]
MGAGVVGAACAYFAAKAGVSVRVLDKGPVSGGTTGAGEGNLLISDKVPGPEFDLMVLSLRLWQAIGDDLGADRIELETKGGVMVARSPAAMTELAALAERQRGQSVTATVLSGDELLEYEPQLAPGLAGGVFYPQDMQVQPMLAAAHLLAAARALGAEVRTGVEVTGIRRSSGGAVTGVLTRTGVLSCDAVVNAAGTWGGEVSSRLGGALPIQPRRGFVLVTEPLPPLIRHKVYEAEYLANIASDDAGLESSAVVEGTRGGTVLIGASRERVGFDRTVSVPVLRVLARQAVALFPFLADVSAIRAYRGFRPYCPDHLPVIGPDPRQPGLFHACGHEGAGIGLSAATGHLIAQALTGQPADLDLAPFRPDRFVEAVA